jgi:N-acetylglucosamine kinase-like BadF-type ATPase
VTQPVPMPGGAHADHFVVLDVGKSSLRAEVREQDGPVRQRVSADAQGWLGAPGPRAALLAQLAGLGEQLTGASGMARVGAGIAGYDLAPPAVQADVGDALIAAFERARVFVASDAVTAHLGAFGGKPGVLLVAGTGAVAVAASRAGVLDRAGGLGPDLGDEGSGGWIGREGCQAAARSLDGRGAPTSLAVRCERTFGVPATQLGPLLAASVSPAGLFGRFAPEVLEAWLDGDEVAQDIAERAAEHLAAAAIAVLRRPGDHDQQFAVVGGLAAHAAFTAAVISRVADAVPAVAYVAARGDGLDGAALLIG